MRYEDVVLADGPVGYWPMLELSGTTAKAYGSAGGDGSWNGTPILGAVPFPAGGRAPYLGAAPYVSVVDSPNWSGAGASGVLTVEVWFRLQGLLANVSFLMSKGSGSNYEWDLRVNTTGTVGWECIVSSGASSSGRVSGAIVPQRWNHVVGTWDKAANVQALWLNGRLVDTGTAGVTMTDGAATLQFGRRADAGGVMFDGHLAHAAIYTKVLSTNRIMAHYRAGLARPTRLPLRTRAA